MKTGRDTTVELMRIIGSFIVVGVHCCLPFSMDGQLDFSRLLLATFFSDGVAVFWIITGFFIFNNNNQKKALGHWAKRIMLPTALYVLAAMYLMPFLIENKSWKESLISVAKSIRELPYIVSTGTTSAIPEGGHLWYVVIYTLLIFLFPLIEKYKSVSTENRKYLWIVLGGLLIFNDLSMGRFFAFSHHGVNALCPAIVLCALGCEFWENRYRFKEKKYLFGVSGGLFLAMNIIRAYVVWRSSAAPDHTHYLFWYTSFGMICAVLLVIMCSVIEIKNEKVKNVVGIIGKNTFGIYLIHNLVKNTLNAKLHFEETLQHIFLKNETFLKAVIYTLITTIVVYLTSFLILLLIEKMRMIIKKLFKTFKGIRCNFRGVVRN